MGLRRSTTAFQTRLSLPLPVSSGTALRPSLHPPLERLQRSVSAKLSMIKRDATSSRPAGGVSRLRLAVPPPSRRCRSYRRWLLGEANYSSSLTQQPKRALLNCRTDVSVVGCMGRLALRRNILFSVVDMRFQLRKSRPATGSGTASEDRTRTTYTALLLPLQSICRAKRTSRLAAGCWCRP